MFIGWIRKDSILDDIKALSDDVLIDDNLIISTIFKNENLCFGAYDGPLLCALISAYEFENKIYINGFIYKDDFSNTDKKRLIKILLDNIDDKNKTIIFMSSLTELPLFEELGFLKFSTFTKVLYTGKSVAFNFTNAMAKDIHSDGYNNNFNNFDKSIFDDDRKDYIENTVLKNSSLFLSNTFGYQHSYALSKSLIKLSPWVMVTEVYSEAEKLIRGLIHYRGLKNILAFIPKDVSDITELYKLYNFEFRDNYELIYKNEKPNIKIENIYAF
jgi:hypothetical protein